nr:hypothetical protein [Tanacetum cinerariifolium]
HAVALTPSLPVPSLPLPLPSPLTISPTDVEAPLGYKKARIKIRALHLSTSRRTDIPEADMPPQKRVCLTTPTLGFNVRREDRPDNCRTAMLLDRETMYAREAWAGSKDKSAAIEAHVQTLEAQVATLIA